MTERQYNFIQLQGSLPKHLNFQNISYDYVLFHPKLAAAKYACAKTCSICVCVLCVYNVKTKGLHVFLYYEGQPPPPTKKTKLIMFLPNRLPAY
jgi:hypothetical protein